MRRRRLSMAALLLLLLASLTLLRQPAQAASPADTHCVNPGGTGDCVNKIQTAIDAAVSGDTVLIYAGTYHEHIQLGKNVSLVGMGWEDTIITGDWLADTTVINVAAAVGPETTISGLQVTQGDGIDGGCIKLLGASPVIRDTWVYDCRADYGGGVYVSGGAPIFDNVPVWSSVASQHGGGIYIYRGRVTLTTSSAGGTNGTMLNNTALRGGAVYIEANTAVTLSHLRLGGNEAVNSGGAVHSDSPITVTYSAISANRAFMGGGMFLSSAVVAIRGNRIDGNEARLEGGGGGIALWNSTGHITDNFLIGNTGGYGAGVDIYESPAGNAGEHGASATTSAYGGPLTLARNWLEGNTATDHGGGLAVGGGADPVIDRNGFFSNTAGVRGGGIYLYSDAVVTLTNNIIARNVVSDTSRDGAGVAAFSTPMRLVNNTIYDNRGDGVWFDRAEHSRMINNLIVHNHYGTIIPGAGSGIEMSLAVSPTVDYLIDYNDAWSNHGSGGDYANLEAGMHSVGVNPLIVGGATDMFTFYHLRPTSPIKATGSVAWAPAFDVDGQPRGLLGTVSMGADEVLYRSWLPVTRRQ